MGDARGTASLASASIVEDMQLGLDLAASGSPPWGAAARVTSASVAQRTRWEHGHLAMIASAACRCCGRASSRATWCLSEIRVDLYVPPLAALVLSLLGVVAASAVLAAVGGGVASLVIALVELLVLAAAVAAAWGQVGRRSVSLAELALAPIYALAKIPIYIRLFTATSDQRKMHEPQTTVRRIERPRQCRRRHRALRASVPDWSREHKPFWSWMPSRSLLATIRAYQRIADSRLPWTALRRRWLVL